MSKKDGKATLLWSITKKNMVCPVRRCSHAAKGKGGGSGLPRESHQNWLTAWDVQYSKAKEFISSQKLFYDFGKQELGRFWTFLFFFLRWISTKRASLLECLEQHIRGEPAPVFPLRFFC
jgi:hypothetical protein